MATTHDDIDWAARLEMMRRSDALESDALRRVAVRLASGLGPDGVVVDAGCGSGGMSAALASVLRDNGGGRLILIDATEELLRAAQEVASSAGGETVTVTPVVADLGAVVDLLDEQGQQFGGRRLLHEGDERFELAEGEFLRLLVGQDGAQAEVAAERRPQRGRQDAAADVGQELPALRMVHGVLRCERVSVFMPEAGYRSFYPSRWPLASTGRDGYALGVFHGGPSARCRHFAEKPY